MKIFLIGGYSCANPGDEAILKTTIYHLHRLFPAATYGIWTDVPDYEVTFDRDIAYEMLYWAPFKWPLNGTFISRVLVKLYTDLYPFSRWVNRLFNGFDRRIISRIKDYDMVIFTGGGYLNSLFCILQGNYMANVAKQLHKPSYLLGQTLGPFRKKQHKRMAKDIFESADKIVLRDTLSDEEVAGFQNKVLHGVDDALAFDPQITEADKKIVDPYFASQDDRPVFYLGINLRPWPGASQFYTQIAQAITSFSKSFTARRLKLIFIPMETSRFCDDRNDGEEIAKFFPSSIDYVVANDVLSVEQKFLLISRLDLLIGMRLHSLVFALSNAVPVIGLYLREYYFRKLSGLLAPFGAQENVLSMEKLGNLEALIRTAAYDKNSFRASLKESSSRIVKDQQMLLDKLLSRGAPIIPAAALALP